MVAVILTITTTDADLQIRFWSLDILETGICRLTGWFMHYLVVIGLKIPTIERFYPLRASG
jgi:hypothetical protein